MRDDVMLITITIIVLMAVQDAAFGFLVWALFEGKQKKQKKRKPGKWVAVAEGMPDIRDGQYSEVVIVTDGKVRHMACARCGKWCFLENGEALENAFYEVTHWMPLPELPKEAGR